MTNGTSNVNFNLKENSPVHLQLQLKNNFGKGLYWLYGLLTRPTSQEEPRLFVNYSFCLLNVIYIPLITD